MSFTKPRTSIFIFNPEEPDPNLQNRITLRKWTWQEREAIKAAGVEQSFNAKLSSLRSGVTDIADTDADVSLKFDMQLGQQMLLKFCIVNWEGPDFDEPCNDRTKLSLDPDIAQIVLAEINKLNAGLSDDQKKALTAPIGTPS